MALACMPSEMGCTGTGSRTGGHEFSFEHVQIEHLYRNAVQAFFLFVHICIIRKFLECLPWIAGINIVLPFASRHRAHTDERQPFVSQPPR